MAGLAQLRPYTEQLAQQRGIYTVVSHAIDGTIKEETSGSASEAIPYWSLLLECVMTAPDELPQEGYTHFELRDCMGFVVASINL